MDDFLERQAASDRSPSTSAPVFPGQRLLVWGRDRRLVSALAHPTTESTGQAELPSGACASLALKRAVPLTQRVRRRGIERRETTAHCKSFYLYLSPSRAPAISSRVVRCDGASACHRVDFLFAR